jgi:hypothetical protein
MKHFIASILLLAGIASASTPDLREQFKQRVAKELLDPKWKYICEHSDAGMRMLRLKVMHEMGLDPSIDLFATESKKNGEEPQWADTTSIQNVSNNSSTQDETTICINRRDRNLIIAGANDIQGNTLRPQPSYTSTDGGRTWSTNRISYAGLGFTSAGDPVITCDDSGMFYYAYLAVPSGGYYPDIVVARSKDGKNWTHGSLVEQGQGLYFEDKEHITIDNSPSSPYYGRLYLAWRRLDGGGDEDAVHITWSDDKGDTWNEPVSLGFNGQFAQVHTGKNGEIFVTTSSGLLNADVTEHWIFVSTDGGKNFNGTKIADYNPYPTGAQVGRPALKGDYGFRAAAYVAFDVDQTNNDVHLVYGSWNDDGVNDPAAVEYYTISKDLGATWTSPRLLGIGAESSSIARDRFLPWIAFDARTGIRHLVYYSSEADENNLLTSIHHLELEPTLSNISHSITGTTFDPTSIAFQGGCFIGDYIGCDAYDSVFAAAWTENRPGHNDGDVFVSVNAPAGPVSAVGPVVIHSKDLWLSEPYPNPLTGSELAISYYTPKNTDIRFALYDTRGAEVRALGAKHIEEGTYTEALSLAGIPAGTYFLKLSSPLGELSKQVVVVK